MCEHNPTVRRVDRQALGNWQENIFSCTCKQADRHEDVQTRGKLLEVLKSGHTCTHTRTHTRTHNLHFIVCLSPNTYSLLKDRNHLCPWSRGTYPYSPPFLLPKAAGNWLLKPRRATKRMRLWTLMFLLLTPDKVESRGPQINTC